MILFTSFVHAQSLPGPWDRFSAARWPPDFARGWPTLRALAPFNGRGQPIKLRDFPADPLNGYASAYTKALSLRWDKVLEDADRIRGLVAQGRNVAICCWCPQSSVSEKQLLEFGTFACHTLLLKGLFEYLEVGYCVYGPAHDGKGVGEWKVEWE